MLSSTRNAAVNYEKINISYITFASRNIGNKRSYNT
jgi:hypothetical protein